MTCTFWGCKDIVYNITISNSMVKKEYTPEELAEREIIRREKNKQSIIRAKKRYMASEKGKATQNRYYMKNQIKLQNNQREWRHKRSKDIAFLQSFYAENKQVDNE